MQLLIQRNKGEKIVYLDFTFTFGNHFKICFKNGF